VYNLEVHFGAVMAHSGAGEAQFMALEVHFRAVMAHSGAEEAQFIIWRFILELGWLILELGKLSV
jgi:hypothetical protein